MKDKEDKTVATASVKEELAAGKETTVTVETDKIANPHLWDVDDPYLYTLVTTVKDGERSLIPMILFLVCVILSLRKRRITEASI